MTPNVQLALNIAAYIFIGCVSLAAIAVVLELIAGLIEAIDFHRK